MKKPVKELADELQKVLHSAYENTPTIEEAEQAAARFLEAQMIINYELSIINLDARMRKTGTKRVRAAAYLEIVNSAEKKPTEGQITALIDTDVSVGAEQKALDQAEVDREELQNLMDIFKDGHVFMRQLSKAGG